MISMILLGFLLGLRHSLEADHVATVATLATSQATRRQMIAQGLAWGIGHSLTLLVVGVGVMWAGSHIPENIATWLERGVGLMMILLALDLLRRLYMRPVHIHTHQHGDSGEHMHLHSHSHDEFSAHASSEHQHGHPQLSPVRATIVGMIHGLAGSAAVIVLFVDQINSFWQGVAYLLCFGAGSIVGMALFSVALSVPLRLTAQHLTKVHNALQVVIAMISAGIGAMLLTA
ncbi:MAG: urease accessory protein [Gammaproteobacteria bacterium]|nr:MAG: urease accessory protein [Gammaproteobacteria bacterium]